MADPVNIDKVELDSRTLAGGRRSRRNSSESLRSSWNKKLKVTRQHPFKLRTEDWPAEDMRIKPDLLQCSLCGTKLCLVAQVYAPLAKLNIEDRTVYVLVCPTPKCGPNPQSWKVLRVQKCHSVMQTDGNGDELGQKKESVCSNEPSSTSSPEKHNNENKCHESNDDDFDLDALAEALEQAATLASSSKKQNKSKRANAPIKCAMVKGKVDGLSTPVLPCFYIYYDKEQSRGKDTVGAALRRFRSGRRRRVGARLQGRHHAEVARVRLRQLQQPH